MPSEMPFIIPAKDGWEPSMWTILKLQVIARKHGFFADWPTVTVTQEHNLLLDCEPIVGELGQDLVAVKSHGRWKIVTEYEYLQGGEDA